MVLSFGEAQNSIEGMSDERLACSAGWFVPERRAGRVERVRLPARENEKKRDCDRGEERRAPEFCGSLAVSQLPQVKSDCQALQMVHEGDAGIAQVSHRVRK